MVSPRSSSLNDCMPGLRGHSRAALSMFFLTSSAAPIAAACLAAMSAMSLARSAVFTFERISRAGKSGARAEISPTTSSTPPQSLASASSLAVVALLYILRRSSRFSDGKTASFTSCSPIRKVSSKRSRAACLSPLSYRVSTAAIPSDTSLRASMAIISSASDVGVKLEICTRSFTCSRPTCNSCALPL